MAGGARGFHVVIRYAADKGVKVIAAFVIWIDRPSFVASGLAVS